MGYGGGDGPVVRDHGEVWFTRGKEGGEGFESFDEAVGSVEVGVATIQAGGVCRAVEGKVGLIELGEGVEELLEGCSFLSIVVGVVACVEFLEVG